MKTNNPSFSFLSNLLAKDENYQLASYLFLKCLAIIYFIAFASMSVQIIGLVGENGILPFQEQLQQVWQNHNNAALWRLPNVFWVNHSDFSLQLVTWLGCALAIMLFLGIIPQLCLIALFILYLSLFHAGQIFLNFQWDTLLLESGFLAIFLHNHPSKLIIFLFHWLLFRLRFLSGISKIISGDPTWSSLTTLNFYFETQPLPHIGAWYAHQLPEWILQAGTLMALCMELIVPLFIFLPRKFRIFAAFSTIILQLIIIATSNHNFINILTIILCLFLLDDQFITRLLPSFLHSRILKQSENNQTRSFLPFKKTISSLLAILLLAISLTQIYWYVFNQTLHPPLRDIARIGHRYGFGNVFHVFPTMQTQRYEFLIQGSYDGDKWYQYDFKYKPGPLMQAPVFNVPHQPRLDWMIWFVPPKFSKMQQWFDQFMFRLWKNEKSVTDLLRFNPFENQAAPKFLRVLVFQYHFTSFEEKEKTGHWWKAEFLGIYPNFPPRRP